jgi:hypothetical protein
MSKILPGPPPPEKKTLSYLKSTKTFKNKIINVIEILFPNIALQYENTIEIYNVETMETLDQIQRISSITNFFSMRKNKIFFSANQHCSVYDLNLKKIVYDEILLNRQTYFTFPSIPIRNVPNSDKFAFNTKDKTISIVDHENISETKTIKIQMSIVDFLFFDENKFVVTDETDVAIYNDLGETLFLYSTNGTVLWTMSYFQILKEDFLIVLTTGFHHYHHDQIKKVSMIDFKFLTMISENVFLKMNRRNKLEIFSIGSNSKVKSMKILQMESDGSFDSVLLASNGELITWDQYNLRNWDTSQFLNSITIESHFLNSFKKDKLKDLKFHF